ncbi:CHST3-like protein [Mya arenaria]|uniref:CHST3-like protein n=1 Tax=Mya arenaria TaxID=6604 RepID=A0ABY7E296_MYAAR|nr:CHST3-like protein [Mya arenaria]
MATPDKSHRLPPLEFNSEATDEMYNWFTCDIPKLPNIALLDMFMNKGMKSAMMTDCYRDAVKKVRDSSTALLLCAKQLKSVCLNSPFRIIKTIRLELSTVSYLLDRLPNLQIIHLVRDPRATLASQAKLGMCKQSKGGQPGCTERFCKRLENDVLEEENILRKHQGRIMPVFYEDIAREPIQTSKKMYDFIGAEFTHSAEQYIFNITMAGLENDCAICTTRSNSTEHIDSWKTKMKLEFKTIVQARCNYILRRYGYKIYTQDEFINMARKTK